MSKVLTDLLIDAATSKGITPIALYDGGISSIEGVEVQETFYELKVYADSEESVADKLKPYFESFFKQARDSWKVDKVAFRAVIAKPDEITPTETFVSFALAFGIDEVIEEEYVDSRQVAVGESLRESFDRFIR